MSIVDGNASDDGDNPGSNQHDEDEENDDERNTEGRKLKPWKTGDFAREEIKQGYVNEDNNTPKNLRRSSSRRRNQDTSQLVFMTEETIMGNVSEYQPTSAEHAVKMEDKST